jgi:hypothetical protein
MFIVYDHGIVYERKDFFSCIIPKCLQVTCLFCNSSMVLMARPTHPGWLARLLRMLRRGVSSWHIIAWVNLEADIPDFRSFPETKEMSPDEKKFNFASRGQELSGVGLTATLLGDEVRRT